MKKLTIAIAFCAASAVMWAQEPQPQQDKPDLTVRGCIRPGPAADIWILTDATVESGAVAGQTGRFRLVIGNDEVQFKPHANHRVKVVGPSDGRPFPPPGKDVPATELPTLSVKSLTMVSTECV
jgi:hypothetical protein